MAKHGMSSWSFSSSGVTSGLPDQSWPMTEVDFTLSRCQVNEKGICRGLTSKLNSSSCKSSGSAPIISQTVAIRLSQVYHSKNIGSCKSGCIKCWTPHISSLSAGNGGNCFPTARTYLHLAGSSGPALARSSTRSDASLNLLSQGSSSNPST